MESTQPFVFSLGAVLAAAGLDPHDVLAIRHTYKVSGLPSRAAATPERVLAYTREQLHSGKFPKEPARFWLVFMAEGALRSRLTAVYENRGESVAERTQRHRYYDVVPVPVLGSLEERLVVNKDKFKAGSVQIGKRVETHQETVQVPLTREEVVIERHAVTDGRPVEGAVLGAASQTMTVDLEAERANVSKQAYVTEEVSVGKRAVTENQQVTETVGREVLEVNQTGDVRTTEGTALTDDTTKEIDQVVAAKEKEILQK